MIDIIIFLYVSWVITSVAVAATIAMADGYRTTSNLNLIGLAGNIIDFLDTVNWEKTIDKHADNIKKRVMK